MKVSRRWLQTYFDKPIPPAETLAELFTFHSFEVEGVEKAGADTVLDVKILPDRAHYCLSHRGVAEEISVLTKMPLKEADWVKNDSTDVSAITSGSATASSTSLGRRPVVTIEDPTFCRRFTGRYVENRENIFARQSSGQSVSQLSDSASFLTAIGQRSISPVVDITNFVMFDIGQPTHAFDADTIVGDIVIRAAKAGEKITLLDGKEYTLTTDDHVIADAAGALDIAGVKGGKRAEVTAATRAVLLTSANFNPSAVRRTSTRLNLRNEASKRFENEITPELAMEGMRELSFLLEKAGGEKIHFGPIVDEYPVKAVQTIITLDPLFVSERLGVEIPEKTIEDIVERLGIKIDKKKAAVGGAAMWSLTIPFRRLDITIPEDIVEEVGRIYGYDHIVGKLPILSEKAHSAKALATAKPPAIPSEFYLAEKIKDILVSAGFSEVYLYTFAPKGDIEVAYPLAGDKAALRTNLAAGLSARLEANVKNAELLGLEAVKIFEIGKVFGKVSSKDSTAVGSAPYKETLTLALAAAQVKKVKGRDGKLIISETLKEISEAIGFELPVKSLLSSGSNAVAEIELDQQAEKADEITASPALFASSAVKVSYKPFSLYPFIVRDIAVFVPEVSVGTAAPSTPIAAPDVWAEIAAAVESARVGAGAVPGGETILVRHSLFDTFKKDGKVSYAFRLVFQSMSRTLTDVEAKAVMDKVYARMVERGWQVR
jgi:phenylalanyl-tRNA synthetase beta chain